LASLNVNPIEWGKTAGLKMKGQNGRWLTGGVAVNLSFEKENVTKYIYF